MTNQVDHRANFRKQEEAGLVHTDTRKRHGLGGQQPVAPQPRPKKQPPRGVPGGQTLAEMLNIETEEPEKRAAAEPLAPIAAPATANVPDAPAPEVEVDPLTGIGEPPAAAGLVETPAGPPAPVEPAEDVEEDDEDVGEEVVAEEVQDEEGEGDTGRLI